MPSLKWGHSFEIDHLELFAGIALWREQSLRTIVLNKTLFFKLSVNFIGPPSPNCLPRVPALTETNPSAATAGRQNFIHWLWTSSTTPRLWICWATLVSWQLRTTPPVCALARAFWQRQYVPVSFTCGWFANSMGWFVFLVPQSE